MDQDVIPSSPGHARPYFLPASLDLDSLPEAARLALVELVQPAYDELVLRAPNSLERAAGVTVVYLLALEVLQQFEMTERIGTIGQPTVEKADQQDSHLGRYLRTVTAKLQSGNFLLRLQQTRLRFGSLAWSPPHPFGTSDGKSTIG